MKKNWQSLDWHRTGLGSFRNSLARKKKELEALRYEVERMERQASFWETLINGAVAKGDDGFDIKRLDRVKIS